ncbi:hypothetical protein [Magnetospirillum moscoviense]|uniref:Uncharacterized protein n=1 Tax=Magnetospirillum moscoviense TaxID=1437059 RepID=A0A178M8P8_9PROT|nr:hypothetical protein [Magnetospirillum moscoviense]MBF0325362.1 hypothetical protein [Alphaproteobacteria bacterium]OAN45122.1 hypothetical protein A6A05_17110 [Magnetospirillum moscoviense]
MGKARSILVAGWIALLLAGCSGASTSLPQTQAGDPGAPIDFQLLTDIPIPSGATMDNDRSLILGERDRWTGRVVMKLWKPGPEAAAFYQVQMPQFGWEPIMAVTSGISVMSYVRGDRAATVQVERGSMWGSTVSVIVGHRSTMLPAASNAAPLAAPVLEPAPRAAPVERVRSEPLAPRR